MSWLQEHAQRVSDWQKGIAERNENWIPKGWRGGSAPGSAQSLADALALNQWNRPFGDEAMSLDVYAGGGSSKDPKARAIGRTVGSIFAGGTLAGGLGGGAAAGGAEAGAGAGVDYAGASSAASGLGVDAAGTGLYDTGMVTGASGSGYAPLDESGMLYGNYGPTGSGASSGGNWFSNLFGKGSGSGSGGFNPYSSLGGSGIGALIGILNAMQQKKDAKKGEEDDRAAVQQGTDAMARSLSIEGNPAGSGRALQQLQNYATVANSANARRRREQNSAANNNLYGAGGFGLAAILAALANSGAFSGSGGETA